MSQAGSFCNGADGSGLGTIAKIRDLVNRILPEIDDNIEIFLPLLNEFTQFMTSYHQRSMIMEKRAIEAARGREKLHSARQRVSREIVNRIVSRDLPEFIESLLMGAWANYLVITLLRSGEHSSEWESALATTDDLIGSVKQDQPEEDRILFRLKLPNIVDTVKAGLEIAGDIDSDIQSTLRKLEACHKAALVAPIRADSVSSTKQLSNTESGPVLPEANPVTADAVKLRAKQLKNIIPEEWRQALFEDADLQTDQIVASPQRQVLLDSLQRLEFGTWFEFYHEKKGIYQQAKLAWINTTTSKYMFVNHGGRQIEVKSVSELADDIEYGRAKIIQMEQVPFVDRALKSIQKLLKKSSELSVE